MDRLDIERTQFVVRVDVPLAAALRERAKREDRPIARVIRAALRAYLDRPDDERV